MQISAKCSIAVHCLIFIHEYSPMTKVTSELIATSTKTNAVTIRNILSALKKDNIISIKAGSGGSEIICNPADVTLYRICKAVEPDFAEKLIGVHPSPSSHCPVGSKIHQVLEISYDKIRRDLCESLERITLADILEDYTLCKP